MHPNGNKAVEIHWEVAAKLNFACHQSSYPILRDLRLENLSKEEPIEGAVATLRSDPEFLKPKAWSIDRIVPDGIVQVNDRVLDLNGEFLLKLSDAIRGSFVLTVERHGKLLAEAQRPVEILARNEWGGAGYMPELLAAFSMPNDPAIDRILHASSQLLRKAGKPDGIDGYNSKSRERVWEITSAIYAAIANLGVSYAVPPASFERDGQKIRLPSHILNGKVATCLDTTMLFAAALEQAGLNPVVALPYGHALIGVWLQPEELSSIIVEDAEILRKRAALKELLLIETTLVTSHPAPPMSRAIERAMDTLGEEHDATFSAAVDIRRARAHRINPLGLGPVSGAPAAEEQTDKVEMTIDGPPPLPDFDTEVEEKIPETPRGRLERWQRKLLDLSARNPLLNHKSTRTSLSILCPDPGELEDKLASGARITIQSVPKPAQDQELHSISTGEIISEEYARDALQKNQLLVDLPAQELSKRAIEIYRRAQTSLQEGGANTLYLSIGFLAWKRNEKDLRRFRAPLILFPVTLHRQSVRSGLRMTAHDDEPRFNTTLLEMLRKDFSIDIKGLDDQLPKDQSGIDVAGIWLRVRRAVKDALGFEVVEEVVLGHFSFAKYLMWKDLVDRTDALRQNSIVKHLIDTPRESYLSEIDFVDPSRLDQDYAPSSLLAPLPADSSQMSMIATADQGKDFIIIGPPGTGKSQTISNMIAHLLGKGKTVLFVSEKTAALNVVYRRLERIGLGRFCLELHSNKAKKADVLRQLANAWETSRALSEQEWQNQAQRLKQVRDRLNRIVNYLHTKKRNGLTPHYAIGVRIRDATIAKRITFAWPRADYHDADQLRKMREVTDRLRIQAEAVGAIGDSPFTVVNTGDWSPQWEDELIERAQRFVDTTNETNDALSTLCAAIGVDLPDRIMLRLEALADLAHVLTDSYRKQTAYALEPDGPERIAALEEAAVRLKDYSAALADLSVPYEKMAWRNIDGEAILQRWQAADMAWWPKSVFLKTRIIKEMQANGARGKPDPIQDGPLLVSLRREGEEIDRLGKLLSSLRVWEAHDTQADSIKAIQKIGVRVRQAIGRLTENPQTLADMRGKVRTLLQDGNDLLAPEATVGRAASRYVNALDTLQESMQAFATQCGRDIREMFADDGQAPELMPENVKTVIARRSELNAWCIWRKRRTEAMDIGLERLVAGIETGRVPADEIPETFEAAYCTWWSRQLFGEDDELRIWSTPEHEDAIEKFRELDESFRQITADYVAAVLCGGIPEENSTGRDRQWGLVRKLTKQKRPRVPIRQMIEDAPEPFSKLAPCVMMSPLSIAQYLPAGQAPFDVVIFDEASQVTVWDAVGAIARGKQTVIAGDPKQMPPTNFFARADDDPDGEVNYEGDMESILDELQSAGIPEKPLNLHYRSRRESLIAFSNKQYYDNRLITFPAPIHPDMGVRLVQSDGFYARGTARHNEGEAKAIVDEIVRRLKSGKEIEREATIGVVTFNAEQQSLILDLLDRERRSDPEIEWAFAETAEEPVFVKNLETVQGDERDVILFSITYGPDQAGHVTMNFGPLNRDGGERRLNVAMTRARSEMLVFSILSPDKIDLSRTKAEAVKHLKHFLEYAERGPSALGAEVHGPVGDFESPFETAVARALRDLGWSLHPQIGVSAFRIDIGIVHPDEAGRFLAGVECDGAMYHSSKFARERDKIRQAVLEELGWKLFRVWSTDWWLDRNNALDKLDNQLKAHLKEDRRNRQAAEEETKASEQDSGAVGGTTVHNRNARPENAAEEQLSERAVSGANQSSPPAEADVGVSAEHLYKKASLKSGNFSPEPELFYDTDYRERLNAMIRYIISVEAPVHEDVLIRRIARHHGFRRAGRQIRELLSRLARQHQDFSEESVGKFYWRTGTVKYRLAPARYTGRDDDLRKVEHIAKEELKAIATKLGTDDATELARTLGIGRLSAQARVRIESSIT